jgi:hypothetical protein
VGTETNTSIIKDDDSEPVAITVSVKNAAATAAKTTKPKKGPVDGVVAPTKAAVEVKTSATASSVTPVKATNVAPVAANALKPKKPVMDIARPSPRSAKPHTQEKAQTLSRTAVKKPAKPATVSKAISKPKHVPVVPVTAPARPVDSVRLADAQKVPQSQLITHFTPTVVPRANHPHAVKSDVSPRPVLDIASHASAPLPPQPVSQPTNIFEHALQQATAHEAPVLSKKSLKTKKQRKSTVHIRIATGMLVLLAVGSFVAYQNMTAVTLKLASHKAGFIASLPRDVPSGFSRGALKYEAGLVAINFQSNSDNRSYAVTEKLSNWDSQTLRENFVTANANNSYQTVEAAGQTIYLFGTTSKTATWVSGGVWYQVDSAGSLSDHQLIELATSMR